MKRNVYFPFNLTAVFTKIKHQITGRACVRVSVFVRQMAQEAAGSSIIPTLANGRRGWSAAGARAAGRRDAGTSPSPGPSAEGSGPRKHTLRESRKSEPTKGVMLLIRRRSRPAAGPPGRGAHIRLLEVLVLEAVRLAQVITGNWWTASNGWDRFALGIWSGRSSCEFISKSNNLDVLQKKIKQTLLIKLIFWDFLFIYVSFFVNPEGFTNR